MNGKWRHIYAKEDKMAKRKRHKKRGFSWGSVITGIGLGLLIGYWLNIILTKTLINSPSIVLLSVVGAVLFGLLGYYSQRTTEIIAYALSGFVLFQFGWDSVVEKTIGPVRWGLFIRAIILLIINSLSGHFGSKKAGTILLRGVGIK